MNDLSFIVVVTFGYGIGTNKSIDSALIKELKNNNCFIDKVPKKFIVRLKDSDNGCIEHKYVMHINLQGLRILLWNYIYPEEIIHTEGSLSLEYGLCDAIAFNSCFLQTYKDIDNTIVLRKLAKYLGEDTDCIYYTLCQKGCPYKIALANANTGYCNFSAYITPVKKTENEYIINEEVWNFFESLMKLSHTDWENEFNNYFYE